MLYLLRTPTFAFTTVGALALGLYLLGHDGLLFDVVAFILLGAAGAGGTGIGLKLYVDQQQLAWSWKPLLSGVVPRGYVILTLIGHLPQTIVAVGIALSWRAG